MESLIWLIPILGIAGFVHTMAYVAQSQPGEKRRIPTIAAAYLIVGSGLWWLVSMGVSIHWKVATTSPLFNALIRIGVLIPLAAGIVGLFGKPRYILSIWFAVVTTWWFWWGTTLP